MARSEKIYVVTSKRAAGVIVLGAFTVKRELHSVAKRFGWYDIDAIVFEVPDGMSRISKGIGRTYKLTEAW